MTDTKDYNNQHDTIFLQPWCEGCENNIFEGREWCQDDAWGECDECGRKAKLVGDQREGWIWQWL